MVEQIDHFLCSPLRNLEELFESDMEPCPPGDDRVRGDGDGREAGILQDAGVRIEGVVEGHAADDTVLERPQSGHRTGHGRLGPGSLGESVIEDEGLFGEPIQVWTHRPLISVKAQMICPQRVDEHDKNVRSLIRRPPFDKLGSLDQESRPPRDVVAARRFQTQREVYCLPCVLVEPHQLHEAEPVVLGDVQVFQTTPGDHVTGGSQLAPQDYFSLDLHAERDRAENRIGRLGPDQHFSTQFEGASFRNAKSKVELIGGRILWSLVLDLADHDTTCVILQDVARAKEREGVHRNGRSEALHEIELDTPGGNGTSDGCGRRPTASKHG